VRNGGQLAKSLKDGRKKTKQTFERVQKDHATVVPRALTKCPPTALAGCGTHCRIENRHAGSVRQMIWGNEYVSDTAIYRTSTLWAEWREKTPLIASR